MRARDFERDSVHRCVSGADLVAALFARRHHIASEPTSRRARATTVAVLGGQRERPRYASIWARVAIDRLFDAGFVANTTPRVSWLLMPHRRHRWNTTSLRPVAASSHAALIHALATLTEGIPPTLVAVNASMFGVDPLSWTGGLRG